PRQWVGRVVPHDLQVRVRPVGCAEALERGRGDPTGVCGVDRRCELAVVPNDLSRGHVHRVVLGLCLAVRADVHLTEVVVAQLTAVTHGPQRVRARDHRLRGDGLDGPRARYFTHALEVRLDVELVHDAQRSAACSGFEQPAVVTAAFLHAGRSVGDGP